MSKNEYINKQTQHKSIIFTDLLCQTQIILNNNITNINYQNYVILHVYYVWYGILHPQ